MTRAGGSIDPWGLLALVCPRCRARIEGAGAGARCGGCGAHYGAPDGILDLRIGRRGAPGFDPHFFESLSRIEEQHFWFVGRRQVVLSALRRSLPDLAERPLFDIGCGSGGLLAFLARQGVALAGACDAYPESIRLARSRVGCPLLLVDEGRFPPLGPGHMLFGMFDVLEHVDDDVGTLQALAQALAPGGALALTVPAHPWLFDEMDELACHRRRYTLEGLRSVLQAGGFDVRYLRYFMSSMVPFLPPVRAVGRLLGGSQVAERRQAELKVVPGLNGLMRGVLAAERALTRLTPLPFGTSLVAVARRRG